MGKSSKIGSSGGIIEESIAESLPSKGQQESITEEEHLKKSSKSGTIDEDIVDEVGGTEPDEDEISEESHLKSASATKVPKVDRARQNVRSDFERDGHADLGGPLRAHERQLELKREAERAAKLREDEYRNSRQIIDDFEKEHNMKGGGANSEHEKLMRGLAEEIKRYEAAVSG